MRERKDFTICELEGVQANPPERASKLGIALGTLGKEPINGLRLRPKNGTNGWYLWCGTEMPTENDAFSPLHVEHLENYLPQVKKYLELPPGYRFLIDENNYEDLWFDEVLMLA
ncbi:immunity protein Imm33 domain-containing protein [Methylomonas sp. MED-D]|uniref:immunity protein Imm33 domain-containing protein n=1 Tax=Methylomonas sp. MED-D TaxID=3418768 RepID=UPI003CFF4BC4